MPRVRRRLKERRRPMRVSLRTRLFLLIGFNPECPPRIQECPLPVPDDFWREAWISTKESELPRFIADHPGRRPWAWWKHDATKPRRNGESDQEYLRRHRLITAEEAAALAG